LAGFQVIILWPLLGDHRGSPPFHPARRPSPAFRRCPPLVSSHRSSKEDHPFRQCRYRLVCLPRIPAPRPALRTPTRAGSPPARPCAACSRKDQQN